mgnify:CR=1 FL=1
MQRSSIRSFTLVELLIVIAILAILAASVVIVLNPGEMISEARDAERVTSLDSLKRSIDLFILDNPSASLGTLQRVYISIPSSNSDCTGVAGLPTLPSGWSYVCSTSLSYKKTDGTGWIPLNLGNIYGGSPISSLPIDPINDSVSGKYYTYVMGGSYALSALFESQKSFALKDGGQYPEMYEQGTNLSLLPVSHDPSLMGYWKMDEASGSTIIDSSGKGKDGTVSNNPQRVDGKIGKAMWFAGASDQKSIVTSRYNNLTRFSLFTWAKLYSIEGAGAGFRIIMGSQKGNNIDSGLVTNGNKIGYHDYVTSGDLNILSSANVMTLNEWHFVGLTYDNGIMRIYCDGADVGGSNFIKTNTTGDTVIGGAGTYDYSGGRMWDGLIDSARIYSRTLSSSEVRSIYDSEK